MAAFPQGSVTLAKMRLSLLGGITVVICAATLKQKKPFVSLKDQVTQSFLTAALLAQVDNVPNGADSNLFCRDTRGLSSRSVKSVFFVLFFFFFQKPSSCLCN